MDSHLPTLTLNEAQGLVLEHVRPVGRGTVTLGEALGRVACEDISALNPAPAFSHSTMDGFAVRGRDVVGAGDRNPARLKIAGEIAAGCAEIPDFTPGAVMRIMTGGLIPDGADRVVPFECCREKDGKIILTRPGRPGWNIRPRGQWFKKNRLILKAGERVAPDHLTILAAGGHTCLPVFQRPRLAVLCTGSELVDFHVSPAKGQITAGNQLLLEALTRQAWAVPVVFGIVPDRLENIRVRLRHVLDAPVHMIVTTGGMGPGKYDLVEQAFRSFAGRSFFRSLSVRPGRATLFGMLADRPFFALPGPPHAVRALFSALVRPALLKAQGLGRPGPVPVRARLSQAVKVNRTGVLHLKAAVLSASRGLLMVRPAKEIEAANAMIMVPPHRRHLRAGETVNVHVDG